MDPDAQNFNMLFNKSGASISGAGDDVVRPAHVTLLDYEVELGLVLHGELREPRDITPDDLHQYVAGIVIGNDVSARDVQIPQSQFFKGKSYRGFCPVGPVLCLLQAETCTTWMNWSWSCGCERRGAPERYHGQPGVQAAETLSELSQVSDLVAGDLVLTGTPHGCALQVPRGGFKMLVARMMPERRKMGAVHRLPAEERSLLQPGDVMTATIRSSDGKIDLGTQHNTIVQAGA